MQGVENAPCTHWNVIMSTSLDKIIGPRAPEEQKAEERLRYRLPTIFFLIAVGLLIASVFLPYWQMTLEAPQYPKGLSVQAYIYKLTGDVGEIDGLNHYIGMRPLAEAAQLERSLSIFAVGTLSLLQNTRHHQIIIDYCSNIHPHQVHGIISYTCNSLPIYLPGGHVFLVTQLWT